MLWDLWPLGHQHWIYYTNTSPLSTIIWLNIATKLCRRSRFGECVVLRQLGPALMVDERRTIFPSVRPAHMGRVERRDRSCHQSSGPRRDTGRYFAELRQPSNWPAAAGLSQTKASFPRRKRLRVPVGSRCESLAPNESPSGVKP